MKRYDGFEPAILADPKTIERKFSLLHRVSRYAIIGGPDWLATLVKLFDPLLKLELRHFPLDGEDAERDWLSEDGDRWACSRRSCREGGDAGVGDTVTQGER